MRNEFRRNLRSLRRYTRVCSNGNPAAAYAACLVYFARTYGDYGADFLATKATAQVRLYIGA